MPDDFDSYVAQLERELRRFQADTGLRPYGLEGDDGNSYMLAVDPLVAAMWDLGLEVDPTDAVLAVMYDDDALDALRVLRVMLGADQEPGEA